MNLRPLGKACYLMWQVVTHWQSEARQLVISLMTGLAPAVGPSDDSRKSRINRYFKPAVQAVGGCAEDSLRPLATPARELTIGTPFVDLEMLLCPRRMYTCAPTSWIDENL